MLLSMFYIKKESNINQSYPTAMATAMDSAIGQVVAALKDSGMYNDTIIVFTSDVSLQ